MNADPIRKEIQKNSRSHGHMATLSDEDGMDFFNVTGVEGFEYRRQPAGSNVLSNLERSKARQA